MNQEVEMTNPMFFAGLDQHHRMTRLIVIDGNEEILQDESIHHQNQAQVGAELRRLIPPGARVAVEATGFWYWMCDLLEDLGYEVILVHSKEVAEIAKSKKKTDRKDAFILAKLAKDGRLHAAYRMPREARPLRDLLRHRMGLVEQRTHAKNQTHAILHKYGIWHDFSDLFTVQGDAFLEGLDLPIPVRYILNNLRALIRSLKAQVRDTEREILALMPEDEVIRLLKAIPGIGDLLARVIRYEIWDISRFETFKEFKSYIGVAPATWQSAESLRHGSITKQGNLYVRWAIIEAAQRVSGKYPYLEHKFRKMAKRKGRAKARVAVAADLLQAVYFVWKRREPFRPKPAPKLQLRLIQKKEKASNPEGPVSPGVVMV